MLKFYFIVCNWGNKCFNYLTDSCRSSRPEVFCQKGVLENFTKFTGKLLCQSPFFNKAAGLRPAIFDGVAEIVVYF